MAFILRTRLTLINKRNEAKLATLSEVDKLQLRNDVEIWDDDPRYVFVTWKKVGNLFYVDPKKICEASEVSEWNQLVCFGRQGIMDRQLRVVCLKKFGIRPSRARDLQANYCCTTSFLVL